MTAPSVEDYIAWATPERRRFTGYATSEEELDAITEFVTIERRQWLLETFRSEILARSGIARPSPKSEGLITDFQHIPYLPTLTREEYKEMIERDFDLQSYVSSRDETVLYWRILAEIQAKLSGHNLIAARYHDGFYKDELTFQAALKESLAISATGYPVRFQLDGVKYIYAGALDLTSVETWINMRDTMSEPLVYWTPQGFWPEMIHKKRDYDDEQGRRTYADVVIEKAAQVYVAPYVAHEVSASQQYVIFDDVVRAMLAHGESYIAASRTFNDLVAYSSEDDTGRRLARVLGAPALASASGVVFFSRTLLPDIIDRMHKDSDRTIARSIHKAEAVADYLGSGTSHQEDLYERLVFEV